MYIINFDVSLSLACESIWFLQVVSSCRLLWRLMISISKDLANQNYFECSLKKVFFITASFEVTVGGKLVFSKLTKGGFPVFKEVKL